MSPSLANARINVLDPSNTAAVFRRATLAFKLSSTFSGEYLYTVISGVMSMDVFVSYTQNSYESTRTNLLSHIL